MAAFEAPQPGWDIDALSCTLGVYYRVDQHDITAMQAAIAQSGALYVSSAVHAGWDHPKKAGRRSQLCRAQPAEFTGNTASCA